MIMARLAFYYYHNMIAILEKYEHNQDFHQILDFVKASHISYALTFNPTVYVSHIRQFWSIARIETTEEGTKILATVDGKLRTVSESSIRRNLKLNDEAGISSLPDTELFKNLTLIGYNISPNQKFTFQKGQFSHQWKYLIHTIMQCLSPKSTGFIELSSNIATALGEGSGTSTESYHTPTSEASQSSQHELPSPLLPPVPTESLPTVIPSDNPPLRQYTRRARIAQSSALPPVADESASPIGDDSQREAFPTNSGLEADQDRANIAKTFTLPPAKAVVRIKLLEDKDRGVAEQSGDDAPIKGRRLDEREEAAERVSDDTEEMATVLTSMDSASILTSGGVQVVPTAAEVATATVSIRTGSGVVSTASPTIPTTAPIFIIATESTPYTRRKGKETMVKSETPKKKKVQEQIDVQLARELEEEMARDAQRMNEQIAWDAEIARIHAEEELQMLIDGLDRNNEIVDKYLQEYHQFAAELPIGRRIELISDLVKYQDNYAKAGWKAKHFKGMTLEEIKEKFDPMWKQIQDFIPISSKEEAKRFKRKGLRLEQESVKKLKTSEEVKATEEVPEEKVKEMMQLVPVEEVYVEALQVKHPIIDWKVHTEGQRSYWKIIRLGGIPTASEDFPLPEQLPTANEDKFPLLIQSDATTDELCVAAEVKE
uniref:Synaptobrevin, longin-like domain protein n=1 Tax=Tanacetum cinerariifolium TaxID=118510 RepID=A0A699IEN7_TANCI|nr:hypothetical protein [Tanacetum cinerariifolium]